MAGKAPAGRARRALAVAGVLAAAAVISAAPAARSEDRAVTQPAPSDDQCRACHSDPGIAETNGPRFYVTGEVLSSSIHAELTCVDCHVPPAARLHADPQAEVAAVRGSCERCHKAEGRDYEESVHGVAADRPPLYGGPLPDPATTGHPSVRPTCISCHGAHDVRTAEDRVFVIDTADRCSICHSERGESFFDRDYHGKESQLGRLDVAVCADCHGGHLVLPETDPRSNVYPANVVATCRTCHEGAPPNFRDVVIHVGGWPLPSDPKLKAATLWMILLLVGTFGFFGMHTVLAIRHSFRERRAVGGGAT